ncbi:DUF305 domain-containing protein [Promicromonospora thailandica]|uniref:Uncharacterized conserved protein, DUF305 family n=1 Tax=Promicromonospora thailandica TaxID=765201 RepID=A0A9X2G5Y7_9MICO|nr:DUF305 domain-containing protein [Promicromonospora thailandica]MCP2267419.1 Uncharacterized conserved protein, DUF305 family [Promicromonospora thailandica]BFF19557.1 hypothetical protein GCM10025730_30780 [Promicromonospora thailandica]
MTRQHSTTEETTPPSGDTAGEAAPPSAYGLGRRLRIMGAVLAGGLAVTLALLLWLGVFVPAKQEAAGYSDADSSYAATAIEHNAQAVQLAALAPGRSDDDAVLALAVEVGEASAGRVRLLADWLEARDIPVPPSGREALALAENGLETELPDDGSGPRAGSTAHSHEGGNHGMLTDEQVNGIAALTATDFDIALLAALVEHHYGGLQPADEEIENGKDAEAMALAQAEADAIRVEVEDVRDLLASVGGPGSTNDQTS